MDARVKPAHDELGVSAFTIGRREFITLIGGGAAAASPLWPLAARAQQPAMPVVGFLSGTEAGTFAPHVAGFRQGLKEAGYVEGQNVAVEYRWADNQLERLPVLAADLVRRPVSVLFAVGGLPTALAAKAATPAIPIVLAFGSDPVKVGLVASLNRPGGNVTGVTFLAAQLGSKRLDLLRDLIPQATTVGFLSDPQNPTAEEQTRDILAAGQALGRQVMVLDARSDRDFEPAFANFIELRAGALVVGADHVIELRNRCQHVGDERGIRNRVPVEAWILVDPIPEVIGCDAEWARARQAG